MVKIKVEIETGTTENEEGFPVACTYAKCPDCGHETMSYGTGGNSIRRCLAHMRDECPRHRKNFYISEDSSSTTED